MSLISFDRTARRKGHDRQPLDSASCQKGFTLIEVLVSVLVLSVGILGVAGMQSLSVQETQNTYFRTQADMLVRDLLDRMRANRDAVQDTASSPYAYATADGAITVTTACDTSTASCTSAEMATFDLSQWLTAVQNSGLPGTVVSIVRANAAESIYTIEFHWDEERDGSGTDSSVCNGSGACLRTVVEI